MALKSGTYVIMSAGAWLAEDCKALALDVRGGSDETNGRPVWLHARNDTDAQLVRVMPWSKSSKYWRVQFLLSDMSLERSDNGTEKGTAAQQWDTKGVAAQKWDVVADGGSVTYGGETYPTYVFRHESSSAGTVLDVESATYEEGTTIRMWTANGTDAQRWFLVPQEPVPDGTYHIVSGLSGEAYDQLGMGLMCLDVAGGSTAAGANIQVHAWNDTNAQCFTVKTTSPGECKICNSASGLPIEKKGGSDVSEEHNVQQYRDNGTEAQRWVVEPAETYIVVNGCEVPTYVVHSHVNTGYVLDKEGGSDQRSNTNVFVHVKNDTYAQYWAFVPAEYTESSLPVPSSGGFALATSGTPSGRVQGAAGALKAYLAFKCAGSVTGYQVRYRMRSKLADGSMAGWNAWRSIRNGSQANSGWGDVQSANVSGATTSDNGWTWVTVPVTVQLAASGISMAKSDRADIEAQVRCYASKAGTMGAPAHGNSATFSCRAVLAPSPKVTKVELARDGVNVSYTTGLPHGGNTLRLLNGCVRTAVTFANSAASGTLHLTFAQLKEIPAAGDKPAIRLECTSADGGWAATTSSVAVAYASGHVALSPTVTASGAKATVRVTAGTEVSMDVQRGHGTRCVTVGRVGSGGSLSYLPPLDVEYRLHGLLNSTSWGSFSDAYGPVDSGGMWYVSTLSGSSTLPLRVDLGQAPSMAATFKRDNEAHVMSGAERPVVTAGAEVEASYTLKGAIVDGLDGRSLAEWEALADLMAHEAFVVVRGPRGFWAQCSMDSMSVDRQYTFYAGVSMALTEVDL